MKPARHRISIQDLQTLIEAEAKRIVIAAGIDDTVRPIYVRSLNGRVDEDGCNWAVSFVQGSDVSRHVIAAIRKMREMYNLV